MERGDQVRDLLGMGRQREVAGVEQMKLCVRHVGQVGASAVGDEVAVIGAPGDQRRGLVLAQVGLPVGYSATLFR